MDLTVLGCSGSFGAPTGGACSGYLVRSGDTSLWLDCGNGSFTNLQQHITPEELTAVVITHEHPDHCVDIYGLHVLLHWGLGMSGLPVYAPAGADARLGALVSDWGGAFDWRAIEEHDDSTIGGLELGFSRTDHPPPTYAVEIRGDDTRLVYSSDTGPDWSVDAFAPGADLVLSEASYQDSDPGHPIHLTARQAGEGARAAKAQRLMLTHLWPRLDPAQSVAEGSEGFGADVALAAPHLTVRI
jgi:ribonuclease BN (tRNA processing enzyme)